jgi:hypothetical protein
MADKIFQSPASADGLDLEAIESRVNKATRVPWETDRVSCEPHEAILHLPAGEGWFLKVSLGYPFSHMADPLESEREFNANVSFIAHARSDIPALIAEVRRLRSSSDAVVSVGDGFDAERDRLADILWAVGMRHSDIKERSGYLLGSSIVRRGRELTNEEKLENIFKAIDEVEDDE